VVSSANVRHSLEDHAVTLAVKGPDLHHLLGHYFSACLLTPPKAT
jgi:hypothetical protein